jgi:hypothetical protein
MEDVEDQILIFACLTHLAFEINGHKVQFEGGHFSLYIVGHLFIIPI